MLKRVQHDARVGSEGAKGRPTHRCLPELVSGSMPQWRGQSGWFQSRTNTEAWTLKRVQGDGRGGNGSVLTPTRFPLNQPPFDPQIPPFGVCLFNQVDFPLPVPILQLLLPCNRVRHPVKGFGVDQADHAMVRRKTWRRPRAVLVKPRRDVGRDADVERTALLAGKDIGARLSHMNVDTIQRRLAELVSASMPRFGRQAGCIQSSPNNEAWVLKRVQDDGRYGDCDA
jgi:hypothetical protein